jgi:hypothetical protein
MNSSGGRGGGVPVGLVLGWGKLLCERGVGSGKQGAGISYPNLFKF